jgi:lipoic acid synthetase
VPPEEFAEIAAEGMQLGFRHVEAGPLVRSSYHAHRQVGMDVRWKGSGISVEAAFEDGG